MLFKITVAYANKFNDYKTASKQKLTKWLNG